ncbi:hypothetical protein [Bradyrhizobium sp. USDA 3364]
MPLHRDIHWLGRQWAVTGHGLQLINQKQMGYYDIEAARLWEARVTEVQTKAWVDRPDFDKALEIARGKFAQLAPAGLPPSVAAPAPPVRTPPPAPRASLDATSVPSIEELLARLKSKSAAPAPVAKPAEAPAPEPPKAEPPRPEPRRAEPIRSESAKSELPKPPKPETQQPSPVTHDPPGPDARRVEPLKVEPARAEPAEPVTAEPVAAKPGVAKPGVAKPEAPKVEPLRSEALKSEVRETAPAKPAPSVPTPAVVVVRNPPPAARARPAWPVFERKIAGSGRFVRPWRVASPRWRGPGLPPRP